MTLVVLILITVRQYARHPAACVIGDITKQFEC